MRQSDSYSKNKKVFAAIVKVNQSEKQKEGENVSSTIRGNPDEG